MKGIVLTTTEVMNTLAIIALIIFAIFIWKATYFDFNLIVKDQENYRRLFALGEILQSYPNLASTEDGRLEKGIIDINKLNALVSDSRELYQDVLYPNTSYSFRVIDLKRDESWEVSPGEIESDLEYEKKFPIAVRRSNDEINFGILELKFYVNRTS